jgi:hypothetical protein
MRQLVYYAICVLFLSLSAIQAHAQSIRDSLKKSNITFQIGLTITDNTAWSGVRKASEAQTLTSPTFGIFLNLPKISTRIGLQSDFWVEPEIDVIDSIKLQYLSPISAIWLQNHLMVYHDLRRISIGLGVHWNRKENILNHLDPGFYLWKSHGISTSLILPFNWLDIEFRTKFTTSPSFAALGRSQNALLLLYNFDKTRLKTENCKPISLSLLMGARFFLTANIELIEGEDLRPIGTAPTVGLQFLHKKTGITMTFERDWWLSLNGGSVQRDVKGYINSSFVSVGYRKHLKNEKHVNVKVGWSAIIDYNLRKDLTVATPHVNKLTTYQVKGVGVALAYELLPKTDVEIKHTFPLLGDELFNPLRASIGLIHRFNPTQ